MQKTLSGAVAKLAGPVTRRGFIGRCAVVPMAGVAAGSMATPAVGAYRGQYAIDGHRLIDGYFASPRGRNGLDVVLILPEAGTSVSSTEARARSFAAQGWLAIAPDLAASYRTAALGGQTALVAAVMRDLPRFRRLARSSGKVIVAT